MAAAKAVQAAQQMAKSNGNGPFDSSKLEVLFEADPINAGPRYSMISVQVYRYNGSEPKIGLYRVGISSKTGSPWQVKELCPLDLDLAGQLVSALTEARDFLAKFNKKLAKRAA
jgi:hypothetical protein